MAGTTDAKMVYERDTDWTFMLLGDEMLAYTVLDRAESEMYGLENYDELLAAAKENGDQLEIGEVRYSGDAESAEFEELIVTAEV